jgi:activator of 2-hydroxyglutaryl-CoA dehydratase/predicted nucleotide-binding protein (sugar kinase/HSP70/actin superfamily)
MKNSGYYIGVDIGSTTVKLVVIDKASGDIINSDYERHEARQAEKLLDLLKRLDGKMGGVPYEDFKVFITGSGGNEIAKAIGAQFVQEVNAVSLATEKLHPDVGAVVEIGGQDSKMIIFKEGPGGRKKKIQTMNDKCAGGTGSVIDKISAKLHIPQKDLSKLHYDGLKIHHVAGKCGVFLETDINSLQKFGVANNELMASLFDAIVVQNLTVLTRGHTLRPEILLLGGPNKFIPGLQQAWRKHIKKMWDEREIMLPEGIDISEKIIVPENALFYAALGAIEYGKLTPSDTGRYKGWQYLERYIEDEKGRVKIGAVDGLVTSKEELDEFLEQYKQPVYNPPKFNKGQKVKAFLGLDGGSTSTKAVLINPDKEVIAKSYVLSQGNPIEDAKLVIGQIAEQVISQGAELEILGLSTTGYAKETLRDVLGADTCIVETVAHTTSALQYNDNVDVICDVGGQDIKIMMLEKGKVKEFKLNTQCSAGNGYFLQSTSNDFNIPVEQFAEKAFTSRLVPDFAYGCAVFLQSDIVNFQRQGWTPSEILAGLAMVLPKNIWLYIAQMPNFTKLGTTFLLQGGTQRNLAAVKAQVDFIKSRYKGQDIKPTIIVHPHCGESGAIGAAIEDLKNWSPDRKSNFIGLEALKNIEYTRTTDETTRCLFCKNKCLRTFIDISLDKDRLNGIASQNGNGQLDSLDTAKNSSEKETKRLIVGYACEKGSVEDVDDMRVIQEKLTHTLKTTPNLTERASKDIFKSYLPKEDRLYNEPKNLGRKMRSIVQERAKLKIGIPRVMLMYSFAPIFSAYFESLGIKKSNIYYSDYTTSDLYRTGTNRGSIDPCFPSKLSISHVYNLLEKQRNGKNFDVLFFPMISDQPKNFTSLSNWACPTIAGSAAVVKAAFTKEKDLFEEMGIKYMDPFINLGMPDVFENQMFHAFRDLLKLNRKENRKAVEAGYTALDHFNDAQQVTGREILDRLEEKDELGIVILGRPYHNDPGINHGIFKEFQYLGYPLITMDALPRDSRTMQEVFGDDIEAGLISNPFDISDIWKNSLNENSNQKIWASKFIARHPNLVALEISSFKCGHDAPTYNIVENVIEQSGTPFFSFKDIDENKSIGSIRLRVETIDYFLKQYWRKKKEELRAIRQSVSQTEGHKQVVS